MLFFLVELFYRAPIPTAQKSYLVFRILINHRKKNNANTVIDQNKGRGRTGDRPPINFFLVELFYRHPYHDMGWGLELLVTVEKFKKKCL